MAQRVKNPPADAGDTDSIPDPGRSHMLQSREACAPPLANPEPDALEPVLRRKGSPLDEKPVHHNQRAACSPQLETSPHSNEDPAQLKVKQQNKISNQFYFFTKRVEEKTSNPSAPRHF